MTINTQRLDSANTALAYTVLDHIEMHPKKWDQRQWRTCFAGLTVEVSGGVLDPDSISNVLAPAHLADMTIEDAAYELLGIDYIAAIAPGCDGDEWLFSASVDLLTLRRMIAHIFGPRPLGD